MNSKKFFVLLAFTPAYGLAQSLSLPEWDFTLNNTTKSSFYNVSGDKTNSPYPNEGGMFYDEFNLNFNRQDSEYSSWRSEFSGLYNRNDDYRSRDTGLSPERVNFRRENGNGAAPYRAEAGDYFSYYSSLTLQRSLKGVQVEFQPFGNDERQHSFIVSSGANQSNWDDFSTGEDYFNAFSWLVEDSIFGTWSLNYVNNSRDAKTTTGALERNQHVVSLAANLPFAVQDFNFEVDAEIASFRGDHDGLTGAASGQDKSDKGAFMELSGQHADLPLNYRLRYEKYGQDFRPRGASISADRRSLEGYSGWMFDNGIRLRARAQVFDNNLEAANTLRTRTYGFNLTGPLLAALVDGVNARVEAYIQNQNNTLITVNNLSHTMRLNLDAPISDAWFGRAKLYIQNINNQVSSQADRRTRQLSVGADHAVSLFGWTGFITPGVSARKVLNGPNESDEISPALALQLSRANHTLRLDYGSLLQNRLRFQDSIDINTHNVSLDYRYQKNSNLFGIQTRFSERDPQPGDITDSWYVSAYWSMDLNRSGSATRAAPASTSTVGTGAGTLAIDITEFSPGTFASDISGLLIAANITNSSQQAGWSVYESRVFPSVLQRQRLALEYVGGVLKTSAIIIDFDEVGNQNSITQTYDQTQQFLIRELGSPARTFSDGEFSDDLVSDLNSEQFIRITEWQAEGGTIRFGIPRRMDGQVRMEIQYTRNTLPMRNTLWSIDGIR